MSTITAAPPEAERRRSTVHKIVLTLLVLGLIGMTAGLGTWAIFSATTSNNGNSLAAGSVTISDDDAGSAMFSVTGMKPGDPASTKCIKVDYTGSLAAVVKIYRGAITGSLGTYLTVKVTRGTGGTFANCTGFAGDATDYDGAGPLTAGVVYNDTLTNFPTTFGTGINYPSSNWTSGTSAVYKFEITIQDNNLAQGQSATGVNITWEAQQA